MKVIRDSHATRGRGCGYRAKELTSIANLNGGTSLNGGGADAVGMITLRLGELADDGSGMQRRLSLHFTEAEARDLRGWLDQRLATIERMRAHNIAAAAFAADPSPANREALNASRRAYEAA